MSDLAIAQSRIEELVKELDDLGVNLATQHVKLIDELQKIAEGFNNELALGNAFYFSAKMKEKSGSLIEAMGLYKRAVSIFEKKENKQKQIDCLNKLGWCAGYLMGNYEEGLSYLTYANEISEEVSYKKGQAVTYNNIGVIYEKQGNYPKALDYHLHSLKIKEEIEDKIGVASSFNNIGIIYEIQKNHSKAIEYLFSSIKISEEIKDKYGMAGCFNNIGSIYYNQEDYLNARKYFFNSLKISETIGDKSSLTVSYNNIGNTYQKLQQLKKAKEYQNKALALAETIKSIPQVIYAKKSIGSILSEEGNFEQASVYLLQTLEIAEKINSKPQQKEVLEVLFKCYKKWGNAVRALEFYEKFVTLKEEMINEETSRTLAGFQLAAEMEQKEKERELAQKEVEIERLKNVELKKAYDDLQTAQEELVKRERMAAIGKIASEIAHEVQNPLNFVNNFSELNIEISNELNQIINSNKLSEEEREAIRNLIHNSLTINQHGKRAAGIVSQLLELTRKERT